MFVDPRVRCGEVLRLPPPRVTLEGGLAQPLELLREPHGGARAQCWPVWHRAGGHELDRVREVPDP
eukprot:4212289-Pyramimonas_sp.AAC.1